MDVRHTQDILFADLPTKMEKSRSVIDEAFSRFAPDELAVAVTGGKDSTLLLRLILDASQKAGRARPVIVHLDEGDPFPEITAFLARLCREWDLSLEVVRNEDLLGPGRTVGEWIEVSGLSEKNRRELSRLSFSGRGFAFDPESPAGNHLCKTVPLQEFLDRRGIAALVTAIRWDEHEARFSEDYFSQRSVPPHLRVHPLLHFRERDIWEATFFLGLPFCELYRLGYRSLGTRSGTVRASDLPAWEQDLEHTPERAGRATEKERSMAALRSLGYL